MTRMTGPDCAVMCILINTHTETHTKTGWSSLTHIRVVHQALLLLDIAIVDPCVGFNLENAVCHAGERLADAVEQKQNKYRGSFPATYSLLPLAVSTCGWTGSDVYAFIKELAIRRIEHRSEIHSNKSQHLSGGWNGSNASSAAILFLFYNRYLHSARTRHRLCRERVALAGTRQLPSLGLVSMAWCKCTHIIPRG